MTETHTQPDEQPRTGLATENLRSYERLRRSVTDRKIAGVAGGLGRHLNIDPTVLRVLFVVLVFFGGAASGSPGRSPSSPSSSRSCCSTGTAGAAPRPRPPDRHTRAPHPPRPPPRPAHPSRRRRRP